MRMNAEIPTPTRTIEQLLDYWGKPNRWHRSYAIDDDGVLRRVYGVRLIGGGLCSCVLAGLDASVVMRLDASAVALNEFS